MSELNGRMHKKIDPFESGGGFFQYLEDENGCYKYEVFKYSLKKAKEFVQIYWNNISNDWKLFSVTKTPLSDLMRYLKDFEFVDSNILHLRRHVNLF